jgi:hypothetical protein
VSLRNDNGSVLPIVLIFSVFAAVVATAFCIGQYTISSPFLSSSASFQASCTARSGIWKALELLGKPPVDTLAKINTLDSMFNGKMFGKTTAAVHDSSQSALAPDDTMQNVRPFYADSFGSCSLVMTYRTCFKQLISSGEFRTFRKTETVTLCGTAYASSDTTCILQSNSPIQFNGGSIEGKTKLLSDTQPVGKARADSFRESEARQVVSYYSAKLTEKIDTLMPGAIVTVQSNESLSKIPDVVNSPLFIDGSRNDLVWREKRRIFVGGDLQVTGKVSIENVEFVSSGEVKFLDDAVLRNVSVFCRGRLVIDDRASFSGNVLTNSTILVKQHGRIENKSVLVAYGILNKASNDTASRKLTLPLSVFLLQNAFCDGVIVSCGTSSGIKTDKNSVVCGVLWSQGPVCLLGALHGILCAKSLVDEKTLSDMSIAGKGISQATKNVLSGTIHRLPSVVDYPLPCFLGLPILLSWQEG